MKPAAHDALSTDSDQPPLTLRLRPVLELSDQQLFSLAGLNRDLRIERTAEGELIIMSPTGGRTGDRNSEINMQLRQWAKRDNTGRAFDSSTGFRLPNGAMRSPDASWARRDRLAALTAEQWEMFLPLCPDVVIELRSPSDSLRVVQGKMREYLANGAQLGWLIDPQDRRVSVYRPGEPVRQLDAPESVPGDPVLPGFALDLRDIWTPR
jgi:Uma2 family endonuclease